MKKSSAEESKQESELDWTTARPNPYAERMRLNGSNLVLIDADLYRLFPGSDEVNEALRSLANAAGKTVKTPSRPATKISRAS